MARATNAGGSLSSASYVPSLPRTAVDSRQILLLKAKGLGVQNIAAQTGFSMEDVRKVLAPADIQPVAAWPLGPCDQPVQNLIETVCRQHGVEVRALRPNYANGSRTAAANMQALRASVVIVSAAFPALTVEGLGAVFLRDRSYISNLIKQGRAA